MTDQEFAKFAIELEATFRGALADDREEAVKAYVRNVPLDVARAAVRELVMAEQVFMPTPGELIRALRRVVPDGWAFKCMMEGKTSDELARELRARYAPRREIDAGEDGPEALPSGT